MELVNIGMKTRKISVFFIGDVHVGSANFNRRAFLSTINRIKKTASERETIVIGMGDYIDAITIDDKKRFSPASIDDNYKISDLKDLPYKQIEDFCGMIEPIKHLFRSVVIGNHEETTIKHHYNDIYDRLTDKLPNAKKIGYQGFLKLTLEGRDSIIIAVTHGTGGGGYREGYPINRAFDVFRFFDADVYVMGHTHALRSETAHYMTVAKNDRIIKKARHYGVSGTFLESHAEGKRSYFDGKPGMPSPIGCLEYRMTRNGELQSGYKTELIKHLMG